MSSIISSDYQGFRNIKTEINKWGSNNDIDTSDATAGQVIWPVKAGTQQYLFLDAAIPLFLVSTDAADTSAGTGARSVKGMYQTVEDTKIFEVNTNGLTNVPLPENSVGVFRFGIETSGSGNTNAGNLNIVDGSGNIYAQIVAGEGQTQIAVFRVPTSFSKGVISSHSVKYGRRGSTSTAELRLRIRKPDGTVIGKWDASLSTSNTEDAREYDKFGGITVNPGEWVYWEATEVSGNATPINARFDIRLIGE